MPGIIDHSRSSSTPADSLIRSGATPTLGFIGARQHALLILMHDGSHFRLFPDRRVNDWVGELFLAWPFLAFSMQAYRRSHFQHHRHVNSERDPDWMRKQSPDWNFPKRPGDLARLLLMTLCGVGLLRQLRYAREIARQRPAPDAQTAATSRAFRIGRLIFLALLATGIVAGGLLIPFLCFWAVPFLIWTQLVLHLRSIAEHFALERSQREGLFGQSRNTLTNAFDRVFIAPKNIGLHLDHHLHPSVPFHRLPELHEQLLGDPGYRAAAHHTWGYRRVLRECIGTPTAQHIRTQTS